MGCVFDCAVGLVFVDYSGGLVSTWCSLCGVGSVLVLVWRWFGFYSCLAGFTWFVVGFWVWFGFVVDFVVLLTLYLGFEVVVCLLCVV